MFLKERDITIDDKGPKRRFNLLYLLLASPLATVSPLKIAGEQMNSFDWYSFIVINFKMKIQKKAMVSLFLKNFPGYFNNFKSYSSWILLKDFIAYFCLSLCVGCVGLWL